MLLDIIIKIQMNAVTLSTAVMEVSVITILDVLAVDALWIIMEHLPILEILVQKVRARDTTEIQSQCPRKSKLGKLQKIDLLLTPKNSILGWGDTVLVVGAFDI